MDDVKLEDRRFILWDTIRDGEIRYPSDERPRDLDVGQRIQSVKYGLSGERGEYDIYRVV